VTGRDPDASSGLAGREAPKLHAVVRRDLKTLLISHILHETSAYMGRKDEMKKVRYQILLPVLLLMALGALASAISEEQCTTSIISAGAAADSRPILWKNRDTKQLSNKVIYVEEKPFNYLAVVNAAEDSGRFAFGGLNAAGFAIMNSASYNLPQKSEEAHDREDYIMADALRTCATVDDFETYIKRNLGPGLGSRSNFGVIDANGGAASFEVGNQGYKRYDAKDAAEQYLLRTNFSVSGTADQGAGYVRFDREIALFKAVPPGKISHEFILQTARDLGSALLPNPVPQDWKTFPNDKPYWLHANYTIDRVSTASVMVVHGVRKGDNLQKSTLWVILGEPVCSIAVPLWVAAGETPAEVREGKEASISHEAARLKAILRPLPGADRNEYVDVTKLDNRSGTGWLPGNLKVEKEVLDATRTLLAGDPSPAQLAAFEKEMAAKVLVRLRDVH
jgi:hypothetical protein